MSHKDPKERGNSCRHCAAAQEEQRAADQKVPRKKCVYSTTGFEISMRWLNLILLKCV